MAATPAAIERDAWRLFEVDYCATDTGLVDYLNLILERCIEWFDASNASIFLRDEEGHDYRFVAGEASLRSATIRAGAGIAGVAAQTGEAILVNNPEEHPLLKGRLTKRRETVASSIVVPLNQPDGVCIGVLNLARRLGRPEFDLGDLDKVRSVARQVSLAVINADLFAKLSKSIAETDRANEKLQAVIKSLGVAVLVINAKDRITDWNLQAGTQFGLQGELPPFGLSRLSMPDVARALSFCLERARAEGAQHRRVVSEDGRSWSMRVTTMAGGGATATIEETTDNDRAQAEMDRLQRLAEVGQMTAAIAHEIRNPLTGIRSAAQLIGGSPDQAVEFAGIIEQEVMKLNSLCEQFLEFARPLSLRNAPTQLGPIVRGVAERHRPDFSGRQVHLTVEIEGDQPTIMADALRIEQVIRNLLLNALDACLPGAIVRAKVGDNWFSVEDNGCGMTKEQQNRLFTPFFTTKPSGTGLGLSNLRKIVDAHKGTITVTSEIGCGSRFVVTLPSEVAA